MLSESTLRRGTEGPNLAALDAALRKARAKAERDPLQLGPFLREHLERVVVTPREVLPSHEGNGSVS